MKRALIIVIAVVCGVTAGAAGQAPASSILEKGDFRFSYDASGISNLAHANDPFGAVLTTPARSGRAGRPGSPAATLGVKIRYQAPDASAWTPLPGRSGLKASPATGTVSYTHGAGAPIEAAETLAIDGRVLEWTIALRAKSPVRVGDVAVSIPLQGPSGATPDDIFERGFLKHQFISGHGSFIYFMRASGAPPFLLLTVKPGTKLEYVDGGGRGGSNFYVHSAASGPEVGATSRSGALGPPRDEEPGGVKGSPPERKASWRQPHTALDLKAGESKTYGFRMQWANSYDELRALLYDEGLFDVRVVPGMTVPENLTAKFSVRTKARIEGIDAEFPQQTTIAPVTAASGRLSAEAGTAKAGVYEVTFRKLGENTLTIRHDGGRQTYLEFFVTEPLETLIKKRAAFLVDKQQIRDPSKWWNGVYGPYDMRAQVTRTIDDPDIFIDRMIYALTCDDPGLAKPPFLASKNVIYPDRKEIESLEYYIEHFLWGGLQRKDEERPYPYGVYGTPHWFINRDPARRKAYAESLANGATALRDLKKEHVWRSYDYPHIVMLYFHMYEIAKMYPEMSTYLDAAGYLNRAWETARAFYTYPYEIYPEYYETYKWGLYNELIVLELIDALEQEGFAEQAAWLRNEWEKKVKYFVYDDKYPFRSEYAFDRTAFESTYAFAKYGATHDMQPDRNLWFDLKLKKWYSHPSVKREDSRAFMDRQLASGLVVRGWLNPAYYTLGSDPGMSYMAAIGGWGVLDYAQNFAPEPYDWLQLGYASYLSSWALMNTGRPDTNYGFWFPGKQNDGAAGWQFMSAKAGSAWMGSSVPGGVTVPRGPWHYDGEIDLGFGGALRMAATIVTNDPVFGWFAYGGALTAKGDALSIEPRDGMRQRFAVVIPDPGLPFSDSIRRVQIELERDGFARGRAIEMDTAAARITFTIENRTANRHTTAVHLSLPPGAQYALLQDGKDVPLVKTGDWDYSWRAELMMTDADTEISLVKR